MHSENSRYEESINSFDKCVGCCMCGQRPVFRHFAQRGFLSFRRARGLQYEQCFGQQRQLRHESRLVGQRLRGRRCGRHQSARMVLAATRHFLSEPFKLLHPYQRHRRRPDHARGPYPLLQLLHPGDVCGSFQPCRPLALERGSRSVSVSRRRP